MAYKQLDLSLYFIITEEAVAVKQDAVVLARALRDAMQPAASPSAAYISTMTSTAVQAALRDYEIERSRRVLKISVRSNLMGTVLQIPFAPVSAFSLPNPN